MLLGFQKRFESKVLSKEKRHTIRARRKGKRQIHVGDRLDCYGDSRQKTMHLLGRWPCTRVQDIGIHYFDDEPHVEIWIDGVRIEWDEQKALARSDGFQDFADFMEFWRGRATFPR